MSKRTSFEFCFERLKAGVYKGRALDIKKTEEYKKLVGFEKIIIDNLMKTMRENEKRVEVDYWGL